MRTWSDDTRWMCYFLADYDIGKNVQEEIGAGPGDGHGGMMETSRIMAIRPDLVPKNRTKGEFVSRDTPWSVIRSGAIRRASWGMPARPTPRRANA